VIARTLAAFPAIAALGCTAAMAQEPPLGSPFGEMMTLRAAHSARTSSYDRSGGNHDWIDIQPGETATLAEVGGAGCIKHVYATFIIGDEAHRNAMLRDVIVRMYWDGEETPSVECPFGDFFGMGNCQLRPIRSLVLVANPGAGAQPQSWGLNSYFPMPFAGGARIELLNDGEYPVGVWYHIDYETWPEPPVGLSGLGRFHAQFRRSAPTPVDTDARGINLTGDANYVILEAEGQGNVAGYVLNVDNLVGGWWGEGDDMVFIDGEEWPPSFHGTGTEEIFGGGACPDVEYSGPYTGFHIVENRDGDSFYGKNSMYRFFVHDPIRFAKSVRVTIEHGHANDLPNDYSSVAYWYQREPHAPFPPLPSRAGRAPTAVYPGDVGVEGAIDVEALVAGAQTSGEAVWAARLPGDWSRGRIVIFAAGKVGSFVSFHAPVEREETYRVKVRYAKASDLGTARLSIDGRPQGEPFDSYNREDGWGATHVVGPAEADLGEVDLAAGDHELRFEVVGKNEDSTNCILAIDCIVLTPKG